MGQTFSKDLTIKGLLVSSVQQTDDTNNYITHLYLKDEKKGTTKSVWFQVMTIQVKSVSTFIAPDTKRLIVSLYDGNGLSVNLKNPISWGEYEYRLDSKKSRVVYLEKRIRMYNPVQVINLEHVIDLLEMMGEYHDNFEGHNSEFHHDCAVEVCDEKDSDQNVAAARASVFVQSDAAARASVICLSNAKSSETEICLPKRILASSARDIISGDWSASKVSTIVEYSIHSLSNHGVDASLLQVSVPQNQKASVLSIIQQYSSNIVGNNDVFCIISDLKIDILLTNHAVSLMVYQEIHDFSLLETDASSEGATGREIGDASCVEVVSRNKSSLLSLNVSKCDDKSSTDQDVSARQGFAICGSVSPTRNIKPVSAFSGTQIAFKILSFGHVSETVFKCFFLDIFGNMFSIESGL